MKLFKYFRKILRMCVICIFIALCLPWRIPDYTGNFNEHKLLIKYESHGHRFYAKVLKGGEGILDSLQNEYPKINTEEVIFSKESDTPSANMDSGEFSVGGLAQKYCFVVYGKVIGIGQGDSDGCTDTRLHEQVPIFKIDKWAPTEYICNFTEPGIDEKSGLLWLITYMVFPYLCIIWVLTEIIVIIGNTMTKSEV